MNSITNEEMSVNNTSVSVNNTSVSVNNTSVSLNNNEQDKVWLVIGATGQDASYLFELLLEKGYIHIHGTMRRTSTRITGNIEHIYEKLTLHYADVTDAMNIRNIIQNIRPDYIVNFAAQSHVKVSHDLENYTFQVNTIGVLNILQSVVSCGLTKTCRVYQSSTSEMYGNATDGSVLLDENTAMHPVSIYGISKKSAQEICNLYRDAFGIFVVNSVLFNHESPRRGQTFVTRKITDYVQAYNAAKQTATTTTTTTSVRVTGKTPLQLGKLDAKRDWGYAKDYVESIFLMLLQPTPQNFVIATGETHSVREFVELAFKQINIDLEWSGKGVNEEGIDSQSKQILVQVNPRYYRDIDINCLIGDSTKARKVLGWTSKTSFKDLVRLMLNSKKL